MGGQPSHAADDREGRPGQSGDGAPSAASADIHLLYSGHPAHPDEGWESGEGQPRPDDGGLREGPYVDPASAPDAAPHTAASQEAPSRPAWADHPITRALESFYQPGPDNPVQIIADSLQPRAFREAPLTDDWFPLKAPPFAPPFTPAPEPAIQPGQAPTPAPRPGQSPATDLHADFWQIWTGHQDFLLKQCIRLMAGNMADAEDALSNAMLRASSKFGSYSDSIVNERAWLSRLVHNVCIDHYRRQRRTEYRDPHEDAGGDVVSTMFTNAQQTPEEIALEHEQVRALDVQISQLSDQLRVPLMMRFVEGLSYPEIAERLNLRADTVRKRIQLARDHLKRADIR